MVWMKGGLMNMFCGIDLDQEISLSEEEIEALLGCISTTPLKISNLYAGIGGNRKLWNGDIEDMSWRDEVDEEMKRIPFEEYAQDKLDKYEDEITELKKQISKMRNCYNCKKSIYIKGVNHCKFERECEYNPQWEIQV